MNDCRHGMKRLTMTGAGPQMQCCDCGVIVEMPKDNDVSMEAAWIFKDVIIAKLREQGVQTLTDSELVRALGGCVLASKLFRYAQKLRDEYIIGEVDL